MEAWILLLMKKIYGNSVVVVLVSVTYLWDRNSTITVNAIYAKMKIVRNEEKFV